MSIANPALKAALGRLELIAPELCVAYLKALVTDQERWQRHIQGMQRQPRERALKSLARRGARIVVVGMCPP